MININTNRIKIICKYVIILNTHEYYMIIYIYIYIKMEVVMVWDPHPLKSLDPYGFKEFFSKDIGRW